MYGERGQFIFTPLRVSTKSETPFPKKDFIRTDASTSDTKGKTGGTNKAKGK